MSEISKINIGGTIYDIKDQSAREILGNINISNNVSNQLNEHGNRIANLEGKFTSSNQLMKKNGGAMSLTSGDTVATTSYVDDKISGVRNSINYVSDQLNGITFRIVS